MMKVTEKLKSEKGSSFVTAGLILPVFIICVVAMALIINIVGICEGIGFSLSQEIKNIDLEAYNIRTTIFLRDRLLDRVTDDNPRVGNFVVSDIKYLYSTNEIEDLILVDTVSNFKVENPIGILGEINYELDIITRGFTGKTERGSPLSVSEFHFGDSGTCYIFPKYGIRYHSPYCRYVTTVYKDCDNKIEMEKEEAKRRGYTPCLVCNGGD